VPPKAFPLARFLPAPAGHLAATPAPLVDRLNRALLAALRDETVGRRLAELGSAPTAADQASPEAARGYWMGEIARWRPLILAGGQFAD
jgi:tripartite-type tricarboxylate transporter receptor subunit TctC